MNKYKIELKGNIWIKKKGKNFIGKGRVELLSSIGKTGSIAKAARNMGMSYKAAWDAVDIMNKLSSKPLVVKKSGGKGGGGSTLTRAGNELINKFREIEKKNRKFLSEIEKTLFL